MLRGSAVPMAFREGHKLCSHFTPPRSSEGSCCSSRNNLGFALSGTVPGILQRLSRTPQIAFVFATIATPFCLLWEDTVQHRARGVGGWGSTASLKCLFFQSER